MTADQPEFEFTDAMLSTGKCLAVDDGSRLTFVYDQQFDDDYPDGFDVFGIKFRDSDLGPLTVLLTGSQAAEIVENLRAQLANVETLRLERQLRASEDQA